MNMAILRALAIVLALGGLAACAVRGPAAGPAVGNGYATSSDSGRYRCDQSGRPASPGTGWCVGNSGSSAPVANQQQPMIDTAAVPSVPPAPVANAYRCNSDGQPATPGTGWCTRNVGSGPAVSQDTTPRSVPRPVAQAPVRQAPARMQPSAVPICDRNCAAHRLNNEEFLATQRQVLDAQQRAFEAGSAAAASGARSVPIIVPQIVAPAAPAASAPVPPPATPVPQVAPAAPPAATPAVPTPEPSPKPDAAAPADTTGKIRRI